ncbi:vWA domain-containing protein [Prosthecobacter sp.]|uniref:vWA domain-containing protein n=1 Tax=Prosthecobacter sp. TaxID=1965333 RepID=UPI00378462DE
MKNELAEAQNSKAALAEELRKQSAFRHTEEAMNEMREKLRAEKSAADESRAEALKYKNLAESLQKQLNTLIATSQPARNPTPVKTPAFLPASVSRETNIRKELLGLKGDLRNVALVFDQSGSMRGERWKSACELVQTWIDHLDINACVLITFNDTVTKYPEGDDLLQMKDSAGIPDHDNRAKLRDRLDTIQPTGNTNTLKALQVAYACPNIDTIILFTDGKPDLGAQAPAPTPPPPPPVTPRSRGFLSKLLNPGRAQEKPPEPPQPAKRAEPSLTQDIYDLCQQQMHTRTVPVNTVGLGNYFDGKEYATFLLTVAKITGGTFIGR